MSLFKKLGGLVDEIRCDENSYLIWKWHPKDTLLGKNNRENSIRCGSSLRVRDGEVAAFVYSQYDGTQIEFIEGPCDMIIETENMPVLGSIIGMAYDGGTPFQAEIYFINLSEIIQMRFGVPYFNIYDQRFPGKGISVAIRGTITFNIKNYRKFVGLHRITNFTIGDLQKEIRDNINHNVKEIISQITKFSDEPIIYIENKIEEINDLVEERIKIELEKNSGIFVTSVDIGNIEIDKKETEFKSSKEITNAETRLPAIPKVEKIYYVVIKGDAKGPYNASMIKNMIDNGQLNFDSYIWTNGMLEWKKIKEIFI